MQLVMRWLRTISLILRIACSALWMIASLPWHRMRAERAFRRALKRTGLSSREVAALSRLYRENVLRRALQLLKEFSFRRH